MTFETDLDLVLYLSETSIWFTNIFELVEKMKDSWFGKIKTICGKTFKFSYNKKIGSFKLIRIFEKIF